MTARACARATDDDPSPGCVSGSLAASTKKVPALARVGACMFPCVPHLRKLQNETVLKKRQVCLKHLAWPEVCASCGLWCACYFFILHIDR